jgi:NitT/TauT family transport system substrate-binding protein
METQVESDHGVSMEAVTRRAFLVGAVQAACGAALTSLGLGSCRRVQQALPVVVVQGAPSPPSLALVRVAQQGVPPSLAESIRFQLWTTADEMRARITSGQAHFSGLPVNVAANLYNRGLHVQLLNVYIWGILYLVTSKPGVSSWQDLKGETLLIPFRGDLPDILTQYLLRHEGLELGRDITAQYLSAAPEAAQLLAAGRASHAVLSEPSATLAILKAQQTGVSLFRAIDYSREWAEATGRAPRIPMAGVVAAPAVASGHPKLLAWFQQAHREAAAWVTAHPDEACESGAEAIATMPVDVMRESVAHIQSGFVTASEAREEIEFFLSQVQSLSSELVGGQLPPDAFYYQA